MNNYKITKVLKRAQTVKATTTRKQKIRKYRKETKNMRKNK